MLVFGCRVFRRGVGGEPAAALETKCLKKSCGVGGEPVEAVEIKYLKKSCGVGSEPAVAVETKCLKMSYMREARLQLWNETEWKPFLMACSPSLSQFRC